MAAPHDMIEMVEPMIPALRRYARALVRDREEADDLVQDCLERAITRWHQRRTDGSVRAWMFTMLHNLAINRLRRDQRRGRHVSIEADEAPLPGVAAAQEDGLHHHDLMAALDTLPEDQRQVLLLIALEEMSYAQAAAITGVPLGTVMSRLSRGRERLRALLSGGTRASHPALRRIK